MQLSKEILLTTSESCQSNQICIWDLISFSPLLQLKDGAIAAENTLCPVYQEYAYIGIKGKPLLHRWRLCNEQKSKILTTQVVPGHISAIAISEDGMLLAAAIEEKIFLWQCNSGDLLAVLSGQSVRSIEQLRFHESTFLVSASKDGVVSVWSISSIGALYSSLSQPSVEPFFTMMPCTCSVRFALVDIVTDVLIVVAGLNGQVKVYSLYSRRLLEDPRGSLHADRPIYCILNSPVGQLLFFGSSNGVIMSTSLSQSHKEYLTVKERHILREKNHPKNAEDAAGDICCLAMTPSGQALACGSRCGHVVLLTFPELLPFKKVKLDGPVTNLHALWRPPWIDNPDKFAPKSCLVHPLKREVGLNAEAVLVAPSGCVWKGLPANTKSSHRLPLATCSQQRSEGLDNQMAVDEGGATSAEVVRLREEAMQLKAETQSLRGINRSLHQRLIDGILRQGSVVAVNARPETHPVLFRKRGKVADSEDRDPKVSCTAPLNGDASDPSDAEEPSKEEEEEVSAEEPEASTSNKRNARKKASKKAKIEDPPVKSKPKTARALLKKNKKKARRR